MRTISKGRILNAKGETLILQIDNTQQLHNRLNSWAQNLANKMANGKYDRTLAIPAVQKYLIDDAAKDAMRGSGSSIAWNHHYDVETRRNVAEYVVQRIEQEYSRGELDHLLTKAALKRRAARS